MLDFYDNLTEQTTLTYNHIQNLLDQELKPPLAIPSTSNAIVPSLPQPPLSPGVEDMETIFRLPRFDLALRYLARPVRAYLSQRVENYSLRRTTSDTSHEYSQAMDTYDARF